MNTKTYEDRIRHFIKEKAKVEPNDSLLHDIRSALKDCASEGHHRGSVGREFFEIHYDKSCGDIRKLRRQIREMDAKIKDLQTNNDKKIANEVIEIYIYEKGANALDCPACYSNNVTPVGTYEIDGDAFYLDVKCNECGKESQTGDGDFFAYHSPELPIPYTQTAK